MSPIDLKSAFGLAACVPLLACSPVIRAADARRPVNELSFGPESTIGNGAANPATPFLRYAPDGRLFAVWTEDHDRVPAEEKHHAAHPRIAGKMAPSPMRDLYVASSSDGGKTWATPKQVNSEIEAVQGEENGPKLALSKASRAYVVWSIPSARGDKTRANIRSAMEDDRSGFTTAQTLNEVKDAARFPTIEATPRGDFLVAWIDRRFDNPEPRRLYLVRLGADGRPSTANYAVGDALCECCKLAIAMAGDGRAVYIVNRQVDRHTVRNHVLRKSMNGGASFGPPVEISDDGWQVPSCPHSGPSIGLDSRGWLHVAWFTLGRTEKEAGVYYSVSKDGGKSFAPRRLVHANTVPEILYVDLTVGDNDRVYLAWTNVDGNGKAQVYMRTISADGRSWSPISQISNARGNASRPTLATNKDRLHIAWTETDGERSRAVLRSAEVEQ
ncbi:MAG TPA: sialidase family protein [Candidatus Eisenbacteria bacterium]|nr:sialidase family protein [Candidatus Eisenbacteria bacterium]